MSLQAIKPMLYTRQVKETVDFYTTVLGFTCENYVEDWSWAAFSRDGVEIMAAYPNAHVPFEKPLFTGSLYIATDNVDGFWEEIKDKTNICYPIESFDYGMREFAVYDNNGYLLQFGQPIDN